MYFNECILRRYIHCLNTISQRHNDQLLNGDNLRSVSLQPIEESGGILQMLPRGISGVAYQLPVVSLFFFQLPILKELSESYDSYYIQEQPFLGSLVIVLQDVNFY